MNRPPLKDRVIEKMSLAVVIVAWPLIRLAEWFDDRHEKDHFDNVLRPALSRWTQKKHRQAKQGAAKVIQLGGSGHAS